MKRVMCSIAKGASFLWLTLLVAGCVTVGPDYEVLRLQLNPTGLRLKPNLFQMSWLRIRNGGIQLFRIRSLTN